MSETDVYKRQAYRRNTTFLSAAQVIWEDAHDCVQRGFAFCSQVVHICNPGLLSVKRQAQKFDDAPIEQPDTVYG